MPAAIPRACSKCRKASCNCPTHKWDQKRNRKETDKLYNSMRWRRLRKHVFERDSFLCQDCLKNGRKTEATQCDHIVPVAQDITKFYDKTNLQSLCAPCHRTKTSRLDSKRTY